MSIDSSGPFGTFRRFQVKLTCWLGEEGTIYYQGMGYDVADGVGSLVEMPTCGLVFRNYRCACAHVLDIPMIMVT